MTAPRQSTKLPHNSPRLTTRMINDSDGPLRRTDNYAVPVSNSRDSNHTTVSPKSASAHNSALKEDTNASVLAAAAHAVVPNWANFILMVFLILGGCCTNVSPCYCPRPYECQCRWAYMSCPRARANGAARRSLLLRQLSSKCHTDIPYRSVNVTMECKLTHH